MRRARRFTLPFEGLDNLNDYYDPHLKAARLKILQQHKNFRFVRLDVIDRGGVEALLQPRNSTG